MRIAFRRIQAAFARNSVPIIAITLICCGVLLYTYSTMKYTMKELIRIAYVETNTFHNDTVSIDYSIYNDMDCEVKIMDIHRSCTCLAAEASYKSIAPGTLVMLKLDLSKRKLKNVNLDAVGAIIVLRSDEGEEVALFVPIPVSQKKALKEIAP